MKPKEGNRRERRKLETRNKLLDTALALFATQGFEATTIDRIAEQADVARQTVLNYFPRKEEFVRCWVERRQERLTDLLQNTASRQTSAQDQLTALVRLMAGYDEQESRIARAISEGWLRRDSSFFADAVAPPALAEAVRRGQQQEEFDPAVDAALAAEVIYDCYLQTLNRWLHADTEFSLDRTLLAKLGLVLNGLRQ